jgi:hypothetical protein
VKLWKVAISLATVGALVAPFVVGTWKARPTKWVPVTEERRQEIENSLNSCKDEGTKSDRWVCEYLTTEWLKKGGEYGNSPDPFKYWVINLGAALIALVGIFGLAMVIPRIALRYWRWLRT